MSSRNQLIPRRAFVPFIVSALAFPAALLCETFPSGVARIVAIGDVHGDLGQFTAVLRSAGLINEKNKWVGGKTHLVQTGDIPDRGPDTRKIMDLLMDLEKQAKKAGGAVHALIGNHDCMNIYGDLRYTTPEEFAAFKDGRSEEIRKHFYQQHVEELKAKGQAEPGEDYRKKWEEEHPLGWFEHRYQFGSQGKYYKWILQHRAVMKVNDTIFLHGGIGPKYADFDLDKINELVLAELKDFTKLNGGIVMDEEGPLLYRGLANGNGAELAAHVDAVLARHGAKRIVVGHTTTHGAVLTRFGGKVAVIDVGLSKAYGNRMACLVIEGARAYTLHRGKQLALPGDDGQDLLRYLKQAAALDPQPSPLSALISDLEAKLAAGTRN